MEERIYVLNNKKIREQILKENHDSVDVGHSGQQQMIELINKTTGGQDSKRTSRNMYKNISSTSKIKFSIRKR